MRKFLNIFMAALLCLCLCACSQQEAEEEVPVQEEPLPLSMEEVYTDSHEMEVSPEEVQALEEAPAPVWTMLDAVASGINTYANADAVIDYSNTKDGYVMVKYIGDTDQKLKARIFGPTTTYTYNLVQGEWQTFPLSDGNGSYTVTAYCNVGGSKYANMLTLDLEVGDIPDALDKVAVVYDYVVDNFVYDDYKAATVKSGYLPVLDTVLEEKKGICFDYASLMAGMLRSQGVPCKLIVGYAGSAYHAWISVWTEEFGWIDGAIYFDGTMWHRMDPTFASSGQRSEFIMDFINNDYNYSTKYSY